PDFERPRPVAVGELYPDLMATLAEPQDLADRHVLVARRGERTLGAERRVRRSGPAGDPFGLRRSGESRQSGGGEQFRANGHHGSLPAAPFRARASGNRLGSDAPESALSLPFCASPAPADKAPTAAEHHAADRNDDQRDNGR